MFFDLDVSSQPLSEKLTPQVENPQLGQEIEVSP